jgi:flavin reductase (DIM6/NTAB) family NADH-FMN oxidoreductase RutF
MFFDPRVDPKPAPLAHNPFPALVAPRPIAWISSISADGNCNLAPYSHYNIVAVAPPMIMFAPNSREDSGAPKDTFRNVMAIPEFVVNIVSWDQRETMNRTSGLFDYGISEFESLGIASEASVNVRPRRVAAAPAALECRVWNIIDLPRAVSGRQCHIVIGEVVGIHIDPAVIVGGRVDAKLLQQVARLGYFEYAVVRDIFQMPRP